MLPCINWNLERLLCSGLLDTRGRFSIRTWASQEKESLVHCQEYKVTIWTEPHMVKHVLVFRVGAYNIECACGALEKWEFILNVWRNWSQLDIKSLSNPDQARSGHWQQSMVSRWGRVRYSRSWCRLALDEMNFEGISSNGCDQAHVVFYDIY